VRPILNGEAGAPLQLCYTCIPQERKSSP